MENKQMPVFVYGTLKYGFHNFSRILKGKVARINKAVVSGCEIYAVANFPGVIKGEGQVHGELMYIQPELFEETLKELDRLEGYRPGTQSFCMYLRETTTVITDKGESIEALIYIWNHPVLPQTKIEDGIWLPGKPYDLDESQFDEDEPTEAELKEEENLGCCGSCGKWMSDDCDGCYE